jgi:predicted histidine transporter YuiF (NhaC family)
MKFGLNSLSLWFGAMMIFLVFAGAVAFTFTDFMDDRLFGIKRIAFIIILTAYGFYRIVRLRQHINQLRYED